MALNFARNPVVFQKVRCHGAFFESGIINVTKTKKSACQHSSLVCLLEKSSDKATKELLILFQSFFPRENSFSCFLIKSRELNNVDGADMKWL